jgi:hypothetical protein
MDLGWFYALAHLTSSTSSTSVSLCASLVICGGASQSLQSVSVSPWVGVPPSVGSGGGPSSQRGKHVAMLAVYGAVMHTVGEGILRPGGRVHPP